MPSHVQTSVLIMLLLVVTASAPAPVAVRAEPSGQPATANRRALGYYVPYDSTSWYALEANAHLIDIVAVQWVTIDGCGGLTSEDNQTLKQFAQARGIAVYPTLLTSSGWLNHQLLTDDETSARAIAEIVEYVMREGYDGFDLDLEAVRATDRDAFTVFVARLAAALHERGKPLALAIPAKATDTTTGWAGAYDYAALGQHADLITVMAYEFHGAWGGPGPIAPYDGVERVLAFATAQIPPEKVLLGIATYGHDWNTTAGGARYLGYPEAAALAERYGVELTLDPASQSATLRYQAPAGERPPLPARAPAPQHQITKRTPPACSVTEPTPAPTPTPRPVPPPDAVQQHEVWLEESRSVASRLPLTGQYGAGGIAIWRLGHEDPAFWPVVEQWRQRIAP
jgi:spore germination protein